MRVVPRAVVEHLRRAEREHDSDLADFLADEIVNCLDRLDGIEERGEPVSRAHQGDSEGWRPIETAPKDRTSVLVGGGDCWYDPSIVPDYLPFDGVAIAR